VASERQSGKTQTTEIVLPAHDDMIRIVEIYVPDEQRAPAVQPPHLVYNGGPLLSSVEVFTVFWGSAWRRRPQSGLIQQVNAFFDYILTSPLIDQLAEYSVPQYTIGHGTRTGTTTITSPSLRTTVSDKTIQHMLQQEIVSNPAFPKPGPNVLYFVYTPPGVSVTQGGGRSCQVFCGYHNDIGGKIFYAVMPFPGCAGCLGNLQQLDALTSTSSHELCEAITDPIPGEGWYDQANGEIGDICAWQTKQIGQYAVQLEWSNQRNQCV